MGVSRPAIQGAARGAGRARATIGDVATALGLSKGTVSRALNGYTDISEATRARVARMAETLGYRPLAHAQAIRTGRVRSLGLVLQIGGPDDHRPFLAEFLAGVTQAASDENWTVTVATAGSDADTVTVLGRLLEERKADGFILPRTYFTDPRIDYLRGADVPFVLYGRTGDPTGCAWFDIKGEDAMADAVALLAGLGHRRIAYVRGAPGATYAGLREAGFRTGMKAAGLTIEAALIAGPAVTAAEGETAIRGLMAASAPPTAIVCAVDRVALGAYEVARELDLVIGRDLSIIAYDGIPEGALMVPPLTTFAVDSRLAGRRLAQLLIARIRGEAPETLRELSAARLVARGSHGPPPDPSPTRAAGRRRGDHDLHET